MITITLPDNITWQITFSFPDKHKPINEQVYTYAKLSRKIVNPEDPKDYAWETWDESTARCKHNQITFIKNGRTVEYADKFDKYMGRKISFTKLVNRNFKREDRKYLWWIFLDKYGRG
jgi:hypothetical protein